MGNPEILHRSALVPSLRVDLIAVERRLSDARERGVSGAKMDYEELERLHVEHRLGMRAVFLKRERGL